MAQVVVVLPWHLVRLTRASGREVCVEVDIPAGSRPTLGDVIDALAERDPVLATALREPVPGERPLDGRRFRLRPYIRAFAGSVDLTPAGLMAHLPSKCLDGREPVRFVGAIAGGTE